MMKPKRIKVDGNFSMWLCPNVYKIVRTQTGYVKNNKTGENCGKIVYLYKHCYDERGARLPEPLYDDNCYVIIEENEI